MNKIELYFWELCANDDTYNLLNLMISLIRKTSDQRFVFSQSSLIYSEEFKKYDNLVALAKRFNGLCELICNFVMANDFMGSRNRDLQTNLVNFTSHLHDKKEIKDPILKLIYTTLDAYAKNPYKEISLLNLDKYSSSHILDCTSYWQQITAYLTNNYPFDLFPNESIQIDQKVNEHLLQEKTDTMDDGSYIKLMVFKKDWLGFNGHSLLIKKTGDCFSFFDPNEGETINLNIKKLCEYINIALDTHGTNMVFLDGTAFMQSINISSMHPVPAKSALTPKDNITSLIISELENIENNGVITNEYLMQAVLALRHRIEDHLQQPRTYEMQTLHEFSWRYTSMGSDSIDSIFKSNNFFHCT